MRVRVNEKNLKVFVIMLCIVVVLLVFILPRLRTEQWQGGVDFYVIEEETPFHVRDFDDGDDTDSERFIDTFEPFFIREKVISNKINGKQCFEKRNFVFIKTMKSATQTLVQMFRRFGYVRNFNFVLPRRDHIYLRWPLLLERLDYRPSTKPFNILADHAVYNKTIMSGLMPRDSKYFTIIREPYSHFKSAFNYFNVANISNVTGEDKVTEYLHNIEKYETFYRSRDGAKIRYCIPDGFSVTKNLQSHCLGMPLGFPLGRKNITNNDDAIRQYIEEIDKDFTLVMIMEYFHESLVLLRRIMCWSMKDIIYSAINVGQYNFKHMAASDENLKIYRQWSHVDYLLYDHFNRTFWQKIEAEGDDFYRELKAFNAIQSQVFNFCSSLDGRDRVLHVRASEYTEAFTVPPDYCLMMGVDLLDYLKRRYDREETWVEPEAEIDVGKNRRAC